VGYNFAADITCLSLFIYPLLSSKIAKSREILIKFDLIAAVQGHTRSSILHYDVSLCQSKAHMWLPISHKSLIVTLVLSATVFEILMLKARKWLNFPTPSLFEAPLGGAPLRILGWNLATEN